MVNATLVVPTRCAQHPKPDAMAARTGSQLHTAQPGTHRASTGHSDPLVMGATCHHCRADGCHPCGPSGQRTCQAEHCYLHPTGVLDPSNCRYLHVVWVSSMRERPQDALLHVLQLERGTLPASAGDANSARRHHVARTKRPGAIITLTLRQAAVLEGDQYKNSGRHTRAVGWTVPLVVKPGRPPTTHCCHEQRDTGTIMT